MASLRFEVEGEPGNILLRGFLTAVQSAQAMLAEYDAAISSTPGGSLDWMVARLSTGSLVVEAESRPRYEGRNVGPEVARSFVHGWEQIEDQGVSPPYLTEGGMRQAKRLVRLIGRDGVTGFIITAAEETVEVTAKASAHIDQLLRVSYRSLGSVEGKLETISVHGKPRFIVYHSRTGKAVTCRVPSDKLADMVPTDALGRRVNVYGMLQANAKGEPLRIDVEQLRWLRSEKELPSTASLTGSDPGYTGEMSTEEYVQSVRGA